MHLTGRNAATLDTVAKEITASGGTAHTAVVDATDKDAVENHAGGSRRRPRAWISRSTRRLRQTGGLAARPAESRTAVGR